MIRFFSNALVAVAVLSSFASVSIAEPTLTPTTFNKIYAPGGFDSNDSVQIVGEGMFRNTCYRSAPVDVSVDHQNMIISLGPAAYEYPGFCLQMVLPYDRVIDVGILKPGSYTVVQSSQNRTLRSEALGKIQIAPAKSDSPDDHLYAPVSQAFFKQNGKRSEIMLTGTLLGSCMQLDEVLVNVEEQAIVLQPIVRVLERKDCLRGQFPFKKLVKLDAIPKGRYLLHVRSLNGKAINTLVDVN